MALRKSTGSTGRRRIDSCMAASPKNLFMGLSSGIGSPCSACAGLQLLGRPVDRGALERSSHVPYHLNSDASRGLGGLGERLTSFMYADL